MRTLFTSVRAHLAWVVLAMGAVLASCGGGGTSSSPTQYTSVAMAGELLTYTIDPVALTYSYTITESQFGLNGKTGSGKLVRNADGSYSPSGIPNARIVILPNGLLLGAVRETFSSAAGSAVVTVPIIGMSNPVSMVDALAGTYNYMHRGCVFSAGASVCAGLVGTFTITSNGNWTSCPGANPGTGACTSGGHAGTLVSLGNGLWQVKEGTNIVGTAIGFSSAGQNVLLIDLKDQRPTGGFGIGIVVGAQQTALTSGQTDGTWIAGTSGGDWAVFTAATTVSGTAITVTSIDGIPTPNAQPFNISIDTPWQGMATTPLGGVGFMAGNGVYVLETANGYAELGVKVH